MRKYNTRFNLTTDGDLHLGHIYLAAVNEYEAHRTGGKFYVRFDDNQEVWKIRQNTDDESDVFAGRMRADLDWLGIEVDGYWSARKEKAEIERVIQLISAETGVTNMVSVNNSPDIVGSDMVPYPYHAALTIEKVIADWIDEISLLIRGIDLVTEFSLYSYFCDRFRLPQPRHVYIPRLLNVDGTELSKSNGGESIRKLRDRGVTVQEIQAMLRFSCLKDATGAFSIENIVDQPRLTDAITFISS